MDLAMSALPSIVLQNSQKAVRLISRNRPNEPQSPTDVSSRPLPKSPVSSSQDNVVPQVIIRSPHVRPGKFVLVDAKRVLQQYPLGSGHPG